MFITLTTTKMDVVLLLLFSMFFFAQGDADNRIAKCFSGVVCGIENSYQPDWIQIFPLPRCSGKYSETANAEIEMANRNFDESIRQFVKELTAIADEECKSCRNWTTSDENEPTTNKATTEIKKCFSPVICDGDGASERSWMQVRPFHACTEKHTAHETRVTAMKEIFENSTQRAAGELQAFMENNFDNSDLSLSGAIEQLKTTRTNTDRKNDTKACYAPVVCTADGRVETTWQKVSPAQGCNGKTWAFLKDRATHVFAAALQHAKEAFRGFVAKECPKLCVRTSSEFHVETTQPAEQETSSDVQLKTRQQTEQETSTEFPIKTTEVTEQETKKIESAAVQTTHVVTTVPPDTTTTSSGTTAAPTCADRYPTPSVPFTTSGPDDACFNGKCFRVKFSGFQDVDLAKAKQMCKEMGDWNLANIYDECYFNVISDHLNGKNKKSTLRIGMTINPQNETIYLRSGEEANWMMTWYNEEFPRKIPGQTNLQFWYTSSVRAGFTNSSPRSHTNGALCEK